VHSVAGQRQRGCKFELARFHASCPATPHAGQPAHTLAPRLQNHQTHIHCVPRGLHTTTSYLTPAILRPGLSWLGDKSSNCTSLKPRVLQLWVFPQPSRCAKILWNRSQHADGRNRHQRLSRGVEPELQSLRASRRGRRHAACRAFSHSRRAKTCL